MFAILGQERHQAVHADFYKKVVPSLAGEWPTVYTINTDKIVPQKALLLTQRHSTTWKNTKLPMHTSRTTKQGSTTNALYKHAARLTHIQDTENTVHASNFCLSSYQTSRQDSHATEVLYFRSWHPASFPPAGPPDAADMHAANSPWCKAASFKWLTYDHQQRASGAASNKAAPTPGAARLLAQRDSQASRQLAEDLWVGDGFAGLVLLDDACALVDELR